MCFPVLGPANPIAIKTEPRLSSNVGGKRVFPELHGRLWQCCLHDNWYDFAKFSAHYNEAKLT
jgi:hypothetical protein